MMYFTPDMMVSMEDFYNHIQVVIQERVYENWVGVESNLLLIRQMVGRLTNTSHTTFQDSVNNIVEYLASKAI